MEEKIQKGQGVKNRFLNTENYLRVRPKTTSNVAFYAPAADITMGLKPVLSTTLRVFNDSNNPNLLGFAEKLATFMKKATMGEQTWEKDGLPLLEDATKEMTQEERGKFLLTFFVNIMDFYWHAMRMTTECPETKPEELQKALDVSFIVRSMPAELRDKYVDHLRTYNMLPQIFDRNGLFEYVGKK